MVAGIMILVAAVLCFAWAVGTYNSLIRLRNKSEEAFSAMDVTLKKRYDLVPNLVQTVKGYTAGEVEALSALTSAAAKASGAGTPEQKIIRDEAVSQAFRGVFALGQSYPELGASKTYLALQEQLARVEEEIAASRRYYNAVVGRYNTKTEVFPASYIATLGGFRRKPLYEVGQEERESVRVRF